MRTDGIEPDLPPVEGCAYLVAYLFEAGPIESGGMGEAPLSSRELQAWQEQVGLQLKPWEFRFIRRLSREYLIERQASEKPDRPAPYLPDAALQENRDAVAQKVKNAFSAFRMSQEN